MPLKRLQGLFPKLSDIVHLADANAEYPLNINEMDIASRVTGN